LKDQECEVFSDKLKFIYIELPKFTKTEAELETTFEKWLYVFRHLAELQNRPPKLQERIFQKLFQAAEIAKLSKNEREAYENSLKHYRDINNIAETAKEEGKMEVARAMKLDGMSLEKIQQFTGLSMEELTEL
ncbi:MAG: PD-(D/E)XK nuclease family transposase, partial [Bacteroidota bacterium]